MKSGGFKIKFSCLKKQKHKKLKNKSKLSLTSSRHKNLIDKRSVRRL